MKFSKILKIAFAVILAVALVPIARAMLADDTMFYIYLAFKAWMYCGALAIFLLVERWEEDRRDEREKGAGVFEG